MQQYDKIEQIETEIQNTNIRCIDDLVNNKHIPSDIALAIKKNNIVNLTPLQKKVFNDSKFWKHGSVDHPNHTIVQGATSSGKTLVGEVAIVNLLNQDTSAKAIYLVPLRAMATEKYNQFKVHMNETLDWKVFPSSSDHQLNDNEILNGEYDIAIIVYEKFFALLAQDGAGQLLRDCKLIVVDEIQMLDSNDRGPKLEIALARARQVRPDMRIIGLTTVHCITDIIDNWFGCVPIWEDALSLPLEEYVVDKDGYKRGKMNPAEIDSYGNENDSAETKKQIRDLCIRKFNEINQPDKAIEEIYNSLERFVPGEFSIESKSEKDKRKWRMMITIIKKHLSEEPDSKIIIFTNGRVKAEKLAKIFVENAGEDTGALSEITVNRLGELDDDEHKRLLMKLLPYKVGFHHAGLALTLRHFVEEEFAGQIGEADLENGKGGLRVLFATETLSIGLNLPADVIILESTTIYRSGSAGHEDLKPHEYKNFIGRAGRLGMSTTKKGISYLLADDKRSMNGYWDKYVNAKKLTISSAFSELSNLEQAPFMLNNFVGRQDNNLSMKDIQEFYKSIMIRKDNIDNSIINQQLVNMEKSHLIRRRVGLGGNSLTISPYGQAMAQYALSLETCENIYGYFLGRGCQTEGEPYPGGLPADFSASDLRGGKYLLDILFLICQMNEVKLTSTLRGPQQSYQHYFVFINNLVKYIKKMLDSNVLWPRSGLFYLIEDSDAGVDPVQATAAYRAILLSKWTEGKHLQDIKKEINFGGDVFHSDLARLAEVSSFLLDAISKTINIGRGKNEEDFTPLLRDDGLSNAFYHFSNRVKYGMDDELVQIANCHVWGVSRDPLIKTKKDFEALPGNRYKNIYDYVMRAKHEDLRAIGTKSLIEELRKVLKKKYTGDSPKRMIEKMQRDSILPEEMLHIALTLLDDDLQTNEWIAKLCKLFEKYELQVRSTGAATAFNIEYSKNDAFNFRLVLWNTSKEVRSDINEIIFGESDGQIHKVLVIRRYSVTDGNENQDENIWGSKKNALWMDKDTFLFLLLHSYRSSGGNPELMLRVISDQVDVLDRNGESVRELLENYQTQTMDVYEQMPDFFMLCDQNVKTPYMNEFFNICAGKLSFRYIRWDERKTDYLQVLFNSHLPVFIYIDSLDNFNSTFFYDQVTLLCLSEDFTKRVVVVFKDHKVKEIVEKKLVHFKNKVSFLQDEQSTLWVVEQLIEYKERLKVQNPKVYKDVFLSYSQNSTHADFIVKGLEEKGISVFRDTNDIHLGESIVEKISEALAQAKILLLLFDKAYVEKIDAGSSEWIDRERDVITLMRLEGGRLIIVVADDVGEYMKKYPLLRPDKYLKWIDTDEKVKELAMRLKQLIEQLDKIDD